MKSKTSPSTVVPFAFTQTLFKSPTGLDAQQQEIYDEVIARFNDHYFENTVHQREEDQYQTFDSFLFTSLPSKKIEEALEEARNLFVHQGVHLYWSGKTDQGWHLGIVQGKPLDFDARIPKRVPIAA